MPDLASVLPALTAPGLLLLAVWLILAGRIVPRSTHQEARDDPGQWAHLFVPAGPQPDPDPQTPEGYVGPWTAQTTYEVGDVVDRAGRYYRCKVAHGPEYEGTWGPPQESVWDDIGPA